MAHDRSRNSRAIMSPIPTRFAYDHFCLVFVYRCVGFCFSSPGDRTVRLAPGSAAVVDLDEVYRKITNEEATAARRLRATQA